METIQLHFDEYITGLPLEQKILGLLNMVVIGDGEEDIECHQLVG